MIRTVIADDQVLLREMLKTVMLQDPEIEVAGCAANGKEAIELCRLYRPDLVLLDLRMPEVDGLSALNAIKRAYPKTKVVILTTFEDNDSVDEAYALGADGYLLKDIKPELLIMAAKCVHNDMFIMGKGMQQHLAKKYALSQQEKIVLEPPTQFDEAVELDKTDLRILRLLAEGQSNKEIGMHLNFSEGSVKNRISKVLSLTGLKDRTQLVVYALKNELI